MGAAPIVTCVARRAGVLACRLAKLRRFSTRDVPLVSCRGRFTRYSAQLESLASTRIGGARGCDASICSRRAAAGISVCIVAAGGALFARSIESFRTGASIHL